MRSQVKNDVSVLDFSQNQNVSMYGCCFQLIPYSIVLKNPCRMCAGPVEQILFSQLAWHDSWRLLRSRTLNEGTCKSANANEESQPGEEGSGGSSGLQLLLPILIDRIVIYCICCNRPLKIAKKMVLKCFYSHQRCARRNIWTIVPSDFPSIFTQPFYPGMEARKNRARLGGARCPVSGGADYTGGAE